MDVILRTYNARGEECGEEIASLEEFLATALFGLDGACLDTEEERRKVATHVARIIGDSVVRFEL